MHENGSMKKTAQTICYDVWIYNIKIFDAASLINRAKRISPKKQPEEISFFARIFRFFLDVGCEWLCVCEYLLHSLYETMLLATNTFLLSAYTLTHNKYIDQAECYGRVWETERGLTFSCIYQKCNKYLIVVKERKTTFIYIIFVLTTIHFNIIFIRKLAWLYLNGLKEEHKKRQEKSLLHMNVVFHYFFRCSWKLHFFVRPNEEEYQFASLFPISIRNWQTNGFFITKYIFYGPKWPKCIKIVEWPSAYITFVYSISFFSHLLFAFVQIFVFLTHIISVFTCKFFSIIFFSLSTLIIISFIGSLYFLLITIRHYKCVFRW